MGGGLIQLVAYGIQDIFLTGDPQITFFKMVYKRHTNFSIEPIKQFFSSNIDFGKSVTCTLARHGDLITNIYIYIQLPFIPEFKLFDQVTKDNVRKFAWVRKIGFALIKQVDIEIGGQLIDSHYGDWLNIWAELTNYHKGLADMIGDIDKLIIPSNGKQGYGLYIPLQFWFCQHNGLALPIVSLQYSEIKIHVEIRNANEVYVIYPSHYIDIIEDVVGFEYLEYIEQDINGLKVGAIFDSYNPLLNRMYYTKIENSDNKKFSLDKQHIDPITGYQTTFPIIGKKYGIRVHPKNDEIKQNNKLSRELALVSGNLIVDYIYLDTDERIRFAKSSHEFLIEQLQFSGSKTISNNSIVSQLSFNHPVKEIIWVSQLNNISRGYLNDKFNYKNNYYIDEVDNKGVNIIKKTTLLFNGHTRFMEREGDYFNWVQPYERHKIAPSIGIYVYSFSIYPEDKQPSGTYNMSKIDDIKIKIDYDGTITSINTVDLRIYAINYNVLRIIHGLGGLAFSN
jgi:hypothetical protein